MKIELVGEVVKNGVCYLCEEEGVDVSELVVLEMEKENEEKWLLKVGDRTKWCVGCLYSFSNVYDGEIVCDDEKGGD